jgi:hypothetical protein
MKPEPPPSDLAHPVLRAAFESLSDELDDFADRHSLLVERYQRGFSMWTFMFQHPKGGVASLQFSICAPGSGELTASLLPHWWLDVEPAHRRLAAEFPTVPVTSLEPTAVRKALEDAFELVLAAQESALKREFWMRGSHDLPQAPWPT